MRAERDTKMREQTLVNASLRTLQEKQTYVEREKQKIAAQLKQLAAKDSASATSGSAGGEVTEADAAFALQAKQALIGQLKSQLADVEQEREAKTKDLETSRGQLQELRDTFDKLHARARDLQKEYDALARRGADAKELLYSQSYDPTAADWSSSSAGGGQETSGATSAVATGGTSGGGQYNAIYAYEATRDDELGLQAGDIVEVTPPEAGAEPGWLHGTLPDGVSSRLPLSTMTLVHCSKHMICLLLLLSGRAGSRRRTSNLWTAALASITEHDSSRSPKNPLRPLQPHWPLPAVVWQATVIQQENGPLRCMRSKARSRAT